MDRARWQQWSHGRWKGNNDVAPLCTQNCCVAGKGLPPLPDLGFIWIRMYISYIDNHYLLRCIPPHLNASIPRPFASAIVLNNHLSRLPHCVILNPQIRLVNLGPVADGNDRFVQNTPAQVLLRRGIQGSSATPLGASVGPWWPRVAPAAVYAARDVRKYNTQRAAEGRKAGADDAEV